MEKIIIDENVLLEYTGELHFSTTLYQLTIKDTPISDHVFIPKFLVIDLNTFVITEFVGDMNEFSTYLWLFSIETGKKSIISSMKNGFVIPKQQDGDNLIYTKRDQFIVKEFEQKLSTYLSDINELN